MKNGTPFALFDRVFCTEEIELAGNRSTACEHREKRKKVCIFDRSKPDAEYDSFGLE